MIVKNDWNTGYACLLAHVFLHSALSKESLEPEKDPAERPTWLGQQRRLGSFH